MYHSTEEIINEVRAQMIAGTPVRFPSDIPVSIQQEIKAIIDRKTPEKIRSAWAWAWRQTYGRN